MEYNDKKLQLATSLFMLTYQVNHQRYNYHPLTIRSLLDTEDDFR